MLEGKTATILILKQGIELSGMPAQAPTKTASSRPPCQIYSGEVLFQCSPSARDPQITALGSLAPAPSTPLGSTQRADAHTNR